MAKTTAKKAGKKAADTRDADRQLTGRDFDRLSDAEKEAVFQQAEAITPDGGRPLTAAERKRWARVKRKMGRPVVGNGSARVQISMERGLLARADAHARRNGITRSQLIARSLEAVLA